MNLYPFLDVLGMKSERPTSNLEGWDVYWARDIVSRSVLRSEPKIAPLQRILPEDDLWSLPNACKKHKFLGFADHDALGNQLSNTAVE